MNYIVDIKVGDKIYKKEGEVIDTTIVYKIKEIYEEETGNCHDGYQKCLYVKFDCDNDIQKPYLFALKTLGGGSWIYGVKMDD
jgi:hypothetical protein